MPFTEEDIGNDALIKEEVAPKLQSLASRKHDNILQYYETLIQEDYGLSPGQDLADLLIRVLDDEDFAERILNTEVNLRQARINGIREDDLDFVLELKEKFQDEDAEDKVGKFIDSYMDSIAGGGMGGVGLSLEDKRPEKELKKYERLVNELREERIKLEKERRRAGSSSPSGGQSGATQESSTGEGRKEVSDLFNRGGSKEQEDEQEQEPEEESGDDYAVDIPSGAVEDNEEQEETEQVAETPLGSDEGVEEEEE